MSPSTGSNFCPGVQGAHSTSALLSHEQRAQVQERRLVERLGEQIGDLLLGRHPVDRDHQVQVELAHIA